MADHRQRNAVYVEMIDAVLAKDVPILFVEDLSTMRDLIQREPSKPIPSEWPGRIVEAAVSGGRREVL